MFRKVHLLTDLKNGEADEQGGSHARYPQEPLTALRFESLRVGQARPGARDDPE